MEICSDEDQFQDLTAPKNSMIDGHEIKEEKNDQHIQEENYRVKIVPLESSTEINLFQKQEYSVNVYLRDQNIRKDIKRRFSDFDMFFQMLFRDYKGYILPAFPQKGFMTFMKSKVTITKNDQYLNDRRNMVERFLTKLLNSQKFNLDSFKQMRQFLSQNQFDLLKKKEKEKNQGILMTSWNKLMTYMKISKQNRYKTISDQLMQNKKQYLDLYIAVREMREHLKKEISDYQKYSEEQFGFYKYKNYCQMVRKVEQHQKQNIQNLEKLEFEMFCANQDFSMVVKMIESIQELRNSELSTKQVKKIDDNFQKEYNRFKRTKDISFKKLRENFIELLWQIKKKDAEFVASTLSSK